MITRLSIAFLCICMSFLPIGAQTAVIPSHIDRQFRPVLERWLSGGWRPATVEDALRGQSADTREFLTSEFRSMSNHPFYVARDFNRDGKTDFAVMLIKGNRYALAVFNAPFASKPVPAFYSDRIEKGDFIFWFSDEYGRRFVIGPPASDSGFVLTPRGKRYVVK